MKSKVIFLGKKPPPFIGPSIATQIILNSKITDKYQFIHLDTSDHRDAKTLGKIDIVNVLIAIKQYFILIKLLLINKDAKAVYVPSQQTTIGYLRDIPFFLITKIFGKKLICHLRGGYFSKFYDSSSILTKGIVKAFQPLVDCQIVLGESLRHMFEGLMAKEKIFVVPNGANYKVPERKRKAETTRILYLSNFKREKGILDTLRAALILEEHQYNFELVCYGNCTEEDTKKEMDKILNNHPGGKISINEPISGDRKLQVLKDSDIFVLPTYYRYEGHPWAIVEAMAFGLPVISTNHAAISETIVNNQNGFLVEKKNPEMVALKMMSLIDHPNLRKKMGAESIKIYNENFSEDRMVEKLIHAFDSTITSE